MQRGDGLVTAARKTMDAFVRAAAPVAGLTIAPERLGAVAASLEMAAAMAELVGSFPLDEVRDEPAPVFRPGEGR